VSLLVKRFEQRIRFVDQLLYALARRIVGRTIRARDRLCDRKRNRGADADDPNPDSDPQESAGEPAILAIAAFVAGVIGAVVGRLHVVPPRGDAASFLGRVLDYPAM
jgi:hypothetical protein